MTAELCRRVDDHERAVRIARRARQAMTEPIETADRIDPAETNEAIDPIDANEPMEPTDNADPVEPMDSTDPLEQMLSTEFSDLYERIDRPWRMAISLGRASRNGGPLRDARVSAAATGRRRVRRKWSISPMAGDRRRPPAEAVRVAAELGQIASDLQPRLGGDVLGVPADQHGQMAQQSRLLRPVDRAGGRRIVRA